MTDLTLKIGLILALMLGGVGVVWGQTIVSDGLNNSSTLFTLSGGAYYSGNSSTNNDRPSNSPFAVEGTYSRGVSNGTATLTSNGNINTSLYSNITLSLRLAAFSIGSTSNGLDAADYVTIEISTNGGTNYNPILTVNGNANAFWAYSASGIATTEYPASSTFAPAGGAYRTTDGYSTLTITSLPAITNLRVRITLMNGSNERWVVDDFKLTGTPCSAPSITCPPNVSAFVNPMAGLMAAYPFNEMSGTTAHDVIGGKDGMLVNGPTLNTGKYGNAVYLDGTNDYVTLPTGIVSSLSGNYTISTWVYLNNNSQWSRIFDFGTGTTNYMFLTPRGGNNFIRFAIKTTTGSEQIIDGTAVLPTGGWHHVVITQTGNTGTLYVDGSSVGNNTSMTYHPSALGNTNQNYIGDSQFTGDPTLAGRVDEFRIYNVAFSSAQVSALYNASACTVAADLGSGGLESPSVTGGCGTVSVTNNASYPLSSGSHTIIWTATDDAAHSSTCEQSVTVLPSGATFTGSLADQCVSNTSYTLTGGSPAGGTYSGTGVTGTNFNASVAGAGTHTITYSYTFIYIDGSSCVSTATNTIKVNALPTTTANINKNISCNAGTDGKINVNITSSDTSPYTFSSNNGTNYTQAFEGSYPNYTLTGLPAGTYYIRVKDKNSCNSIINPIP